ncbi:hypothetical protein [Microvirga sesbaniae]|uniref:hypothetical protein n=1 Tax=Microvirga sesbaniae TaxID=681392 RepID=UPI0021C5CDE8|nr:hypothetical protein [Microvirga sp. HBU67692]
MPLDEDALMNPCSARSNQVGMITENDLKILWVARTLTNIDFQYGEDILHLSRCAIEAEQKSYIERQLHLKYCERREPYQRLLESLRA